MGSRGTDSLSLFKTLEGRILRLVEELGQARRNNDRQASELAEARERIRRLEDTVEHAGKERVKVRTRVESLIERIAELDRRRKIG
jgi:flagellar motility protein MotE (MotC chaperone)